MHDSLSHDFTRWPLKLAVMRSGLTQARVAMAIGKDPAWFSKVVKGYIDPTDEDQIKIASVLERDKSDLFGEIA